MVVKFELVRFMDVASSRGDDGGFRFLCAHMVVHKIEPVRVNDVASSRGDDGPLCLLCEHTVVDKIEQVEDAADNEGQRRFKT